MPVQLSYLSISGWNFVMNLRPSVRAAYDTLQIKKGLKILK